MGLYWIMTNMQNNFRIMIVDDEPEIAQGLSMILSSVTSHFIESFSDPFQAISAFTSQPYDLVISDVMMPDLNGFEMIARLKEINKSTSFIIVTAVKNKDLISNCRKLGIDQIYYKPINLNELEQGITLAHKQFLL